MIEASVKDIEKPNTYLLLIIFCSISLYAFFGEGVQTLQEPISWLATIIPIIVLIGYFFIWEWMKLIQRLNCLLPENDIACCGTLIGCSILVICVLISFSSLAAKPEILSLKLLIEPDFIQLLTLYLLGIETVKVRRFNFSST